MHSWSIMLRVCLLLVQLGVCARRGGGGLSDSLLRFSTARWAVRSRADRGQDFSCGLFVILPYRRGSPFLLVVSSSGVLS